MTPEGVSVPKANGIRRLLFFDLVRNLAMLSVILYHAVAAYSAMAPWWAVHDGTSALADFVRQLFDVYMMQVFFFIAGFFALSSLQRKSIGSFYAEKLRRLGFPWLLLMLTIIPLSIYGGQLKASNGYAVHGFWSYLVFKYLGGIGTVRLGMLPPGQSTQMHLWYISLLFAFFLVFGLVYQVLLKMRRTSTAELSRSSSGASIAKALLLCGLLSTVSSFAVLLVLPDLSWVSINLMLQFQPSKVGIYTLFFGLGVYSQHRRWFANPTFFERPGVWGLVSILLATSYLFCGREVFLHTYDSQTLPPILLLAFAAIRSFLGLAILVMLVSFAYKYTNRPIAINRKLAENSYYIYLVHLYFVLFIQNILMLWKSGPTLGKIAVVFLVTLPASYGVSYLIEGFPRVFTLVLMGLFVLAGLALR